MANVANVDRVAGDAEQHTVLAVEQLSNLELRAAFRRQRTTLGKLVERL
jgi:hypothetical protein